MKLTLVGTPGSQRAQGLVAAATDLGIDVTVHSWEQVLDGQALPPGDWIKLDAPALDTQLLWSLIECSDPRLVQRSAHPGIRHARAAHRGFVSLMERVERQGGSARWFSPPTDIALLADKSLSQTRFASEGLPIPQPMAIEGFESVMALEPGEGLMVKLRWGAAAAGIVAVRRTARGLRGYTTMVPDGIGWQSSRRVRCLDAEEIEVAIDWLVTEGAHAERWYDKESIDGAVYDLRVLTIAGVPTHVVGRSTSGPHPFTNLHLGGDRHPTKRVRDHLGADRFAAVLDLTRRAAACFPRCLVIGFDVMFVEGEPFLIEANPFGDLLHHVLWRGFTPYEAQLRALAMLPRLGAQGRTKGIGIGL